ncbi:MAG: hypothetical protein AB7F40_05055 [Victivallaceae bacterium]
MRNPFEITKAIQFTDEELNSFWVDLTRTGEAGFKNILKPTSPVPMILLGSKGCGKTHIAKYYSYEVQKVRSRDNIQDVINKDGFIGIYFLLGGLREGRFHGAGIKQEKWDHIFMYYMEICIALRTLLVIDAYIKDSGIDFVKEEAFCAAINSLFTTPLTKAQTLADIINSLGKIRNYIDNHADNCVFSRNMKIRITVTRGNLVLNIPALFSKFEPSFNNRKILYIFDEFENLNKTDQKYFQTLLREASPVATSIKLSGRLYAIKTKETFCDSEKNISGSEFEHVELDQILRSKAGSVSVSFLLRVALSRVSPMYPSIKTVKQLENKFETWADVEDAPKIENIPDRLGDNLWGELIGKECVHLRKLINNLDTYGVSSQDREAIVSLLRCSAHPFVEKMNIFLFYKAWAKKSNPSAEDLRVAANTVKTNANDFLASNTTAWTTTMHNDKHFKADMVAQLCRENATLRTKFKRGYYAGLKTFARISAGSPRIFLLLLKNAFAFSAENGDPLQEGCKISFDAQWRAIIKISHWFFEDASNCEEKESLQLGIENLALFLREIRYSDKPAECSCTSFSFNPSEVSSRTLDILESARTHSLLLEIISGRKSKTRKTIEKMYQLNPILCPRWGLAIVRRGTIPLSGNFVEAIFDPGQQDNYLELKKERLRLMFAPFGSCINKSETSSVIQQELEL